jgi:hypothetical protein
VSSPNLIKHEQFPSRFLRNRRDLIVYLPPGYHEQPGRAYPVLYLHDGQNLFDGATSFIPGMDWHVGQTADCLINEGAEAGRGSRESLCEIPAGGSAAVCAEPVSRGERRGTKRDRRLVAWRACILIFGAETTEDIWEDCGAFSFGLVE